MTRAKGVLLAMLASMIALPDFSAREWEIESDGRSLPVRTCIKARPSAEAQVGTVLRFVGECPYGWLHANGQYIVRELYPDLYAVLQSLAAPESLSGAQ
jgi:Phage Tail Collar Domain